MTTDLENDLRAALRERGAAITVDRLRGMDAPNSAAVAGPVFSIGAPSGPGQRARSVGTRFASVVAAAAVVGFVVVLALTVGGSRSREPVGGRATALAGVLGRSWALRTVRAPDGTVTRIPLSIGAGVTFFGTGNRVEFQDGLAVFRASYTILGDGRLRIHHVRGVFTDYRGHDRSRRAAMAGIDAIGVLYAASAPAPIVVDLDSGRLQISTQGYRLTLDDAVPVVPSASRSPSGSPVESATTAAHASSATS